MRSIVLELSWLGNKLGVEGACDNRLEVGLAMDGMHGFSIEDEDVSASLKDFVFVSGLWVNGK